MAAPNKPGKDLSALKAKLAKKADDAAAPAPATAAEPAEQAAAPAEYADEAPQAAPSYEAPQAASAPSYEAEPAQVAAAPVAAAAPAAREEMPFSASGAAFDPNEGLIADGGEIKARSNVGIVIAAAIAAFAGGIGVGSLWNTASSTQAKLAGAKKWAEERAPEIEKIKSARVKIATGLEAATAQIGQDPAKASEAFAALTASAAEIGRVDPLFSPHMGSMPKGPLSSVFNLFEEANAVQFRLNLMKNYVDIFGKAVAADANKITGPFAIVVDGKSAKLVQITGVVCGEDPTAGTACEAGKEQEATGCSVIDEIGGTAKGVPLDLCLTLQTNSFHNAIIGESPANLALQNFQAISIDLNEHMESMAKYEAAALEGLTKYATGEGVGDAEPAAGGGGASAPAE